MSDEKAVAKTAAGMGVPTTPDRLIEIAVTNNADIDKLERLMELQERWNAQQAQSAFLEAMAQFQAGVPAITKDASGHNCKYAPLALIAKTIAPTLKECGLSYRYEQKNSDGKMEVTCIVSHTAGHSERTSLTAEADTSGSKNPIQAIGSTMTYLQRYTLIMALGLTTADGDDDGNAAGAKLATPEQVKEIRVLLEKCGTDAKQVLKFGKVATLEEMPVAKAAKAIEGLRKALKDAEK